MIFSPYLTGVMFEEVGLCSQCFVSREENLLTDRQTIVGAQEKGVQACAKRKCYSRR